jgi:hypothetical protein
MHNTSDILRIVNFDGALLFLDYELICFPSARLRYLYSRLVMRGGVASGVHILDGLCLDWGNLETEDIVVKQPCRLKSYRCH